jgi:hypothetical protein
MFITFPAESESDALLKEMMLYIAQKCEGHSKFGVTKLNKTLFFSDFFSFRRTGKPITGAAYMRLGNGPVARRFLPNKDELVEARRAAVKIVDFGDGWIQHRLIAIDEPNMDAFSHESLRIIDTVIHALKDKSADQVSQLSHQLPAWKIAEDKEEIPYEAAFLLSLEPTEVDEARALELAEKHNW